MHNILPGLYPNPPMKDVPFLSFSWIWKMVNSFVQLKFNFPMRSQLLSSTLILFGFCGSYGADYSLSFSLWCHYDTYQYKVKSNLVFSSRSCDFWLIFKLFCTIFFRIYPFTCYWPSKVMMRSSMFPCCNANVVNTFVYNVFIHEDDTNTPKVDRPPPLHVTHLKIYPIVVLNLIINVNTSHFIVVFFAIVRF